MNVTSSAMNQHNTAHEIFTPYVSKWLQAQIASGNAHPGSAWNAPATVLYADLSGFTNLAATLAALPDGAERLHASLSLFFDTLAATIAVYGGDVATIAGDALTVWWPEQIDTDRAWHCGTAMIAAISALPEVETPTGSFKFDLRVGIAAGPTMVALAGLPAYGLHAVFYGAAMHAAAAAEQVTTPGHICFSPILPQRPSAQTMAVTLTTPKDAPTVPLHIDHFLPPPFVERLRLGIWPAEYRRCVPVFATFTMPTSPNELHTLVANVQTIAASWGGWLNEVEIGDKGAVFVMLFGAPLARGDDPARAVGCCLELRAQGLISRAGITLGSLFVGAVGSATRRVHTAQGGEMNLAAHLMHLAKPGEIMTSSRIRHEVAGRYLIDEPTPIVVKGYERPIPVARVAQSEGGDQRLARSSLRRYADSKYSLVGRIVEQARLERIASAALKRQPGIVIIEGESGIGKSRLIQALATFWIEQGAHGFVGEYDYRRHIAFYPWQSILAELCAISASAPQETRQRQIAACVERMQPGPPGQIDDATQMTAALHRLLGAAAPPSSFTADDSAQVHTEQHTDEDYLVDAIVQIVCQRLEIEPLLIVIENAHWADNRSIETAMRAAETATVRGLPLLLVIAHRPLSSQVPEALARLSTHTRCTRLILDPLDAEAGQELLRKLLQVDSIPQELLQDVERYAQGQPLFIKEYIRALNEHGALRIENGVVHTPGSRSGIEVSDTVQGIIQTRVDRLDEATRLTLKIAAVIGRLFPLAVLQSIHRNLEAGEDLQAQLDHLAALKIIEPELEEPEWVYRFKHQITHEVAYASLLFSQRRELHAEVARWYEQIWLRNDSIDHNAIETYQRLVHHYGRAGVITKQVHYCRIVIYAAIRRYACKTALEYLSIALTLTDDPVQYYELLRLRVTLNEQIGEWTAQGSDIAAIEMLAERWNDPLEQAYAAYYRSRHLLWQGNYGQAIERASQALSTATNLEQHTWNEQRARRAAILRAVCLDLQGEAHTHLNHAITAHSLHSQALHIFACILDAHDTQAQPIRQNADALPSQTPIATLQLQQSFIRCLINLGAACATIHRWRQALNHLQHAIGKARALDDRFGEALALVRISAMYADQHDHDRAYEASKSALTISQAIGDRFGQSSALHQLARAQMVHGETHEAYQSLQRALAISSSIGASALNTHILKSLTRLALSTGNAAEILSAYTKAEAFQQP